MNQQNRDKTTVLTDSLIRSEIVAAARDTVDPEAIHALLAPKATVNDSGVVTVDGKTPSDAVAELLKVKPHFDKNPTANSDPANAADAAYQAAMAKGDVKGMLAAKAKMPGKRRTVA
jgi:hypothetical protein